MATDIASVLGAIPDPLSSLYESQMLKVIAAWEAECPVDRDTTYYFDSEDGDDANDGLTTSTPKQSISEMNTVAAASPGCAIRLKCGSLWRSTTEIDIGSGCITCYGTGTKPKLTGFTQTIASGGTSWTNAAGDRWTTTELASMGWLMCESRGWGEVMKLAASTAEVEATENSFYFTAGTLHVNAGSGVDPNDLDWAATPPTTTEYSAVRFDGGGRVDSIIAYGQNFTSTLDQSYGARFWGSGEDVGVFSNCEFYYHTRHNFGVATSATGGRLLGKNCITGWMYEDVGTSFVSYYEFGGNESIIYGCTFPYGQVPITVARVGAEGRAIYCHTTGGLNYVDALHVLRCKIPDDSEFPPDNFGGPNNMNTVADYHESPYVFFGCIQERVYGAVTRFWATNVVWAASQLYLYPPGGGGSCVDTVAGKGLIVSCYIDVDWQDMGSAEQYGCCNAVTATDFQPRFVNSWIHSRHSPTYPTRVCSALNRDLYGTAAADYTEQHSVNSIYTSQDSPTANTMFPGIGNPDPAPNNHHNAMYDMDGGAELIYEKGYGNWTDTVELSALPTLPTPTTRVAVIDETVGVGDTTYADLPEYDLYGRRLAEAGADIGPLGTLADTGGQRLFELKYG